MRNKILIFCLLFSTLIFSQFEKVGENLKNAMTGYKNSTNNWIVWVYFTDKGPVAVNKLADPLSVISRESLDRRLKVNKANPIDYTDLPVYPIYIDNIKPFVNKIRHQSKWFNGVSCELTLEQVEQIKQFDFVRKIDLIERFKKDTKRENLIKNSNESPAVSFPLSINDLNYGASSTQIQQINVNTVHNTGNYGQGVTIAVLDAGFNRLTHEAFEQMSIIATYDFVNNRTYVGDGLGGQGEGSHGTQTLSTIGGYKPGKLIGPAFRSRYILAKTENTASETPIEMDNWIRALEWADSIGVDVTSTSLGYLDFDSPYVSLTWQDMNGHTASITNASDMAAQKGIIVVNSAGNEGDNSSHNTLGAPADGDSVFSIGAVTSTGTRASFSSVGNTVDGRIKPDLMAMGSGVQVASPYGDLQYTTASGTSFSGPLAAGAAALILAENPNLTPMKVREAMRKTASKSTTPDRYFGWGIINTNNAMNYYNINFSKYVVYDSTNPSGIYKFSLKLNSRLLINENKVKLIWGRNGFSDTSSFQKVTADSFVCQIQGNGMSAEYRYFFYAETVTDSIYKTFPKNAPAGYFSFRVNGSVVNSTFPIQSDWNLISLPLVLSNYDRLSVFPQSISSAFYYLNGYSSTDQLEDGKGYWIKFPNSYQHNLTGGNLTGLSIPVKEGWNLIGTITDSVSTATINATPLNNIVSSFFGFSNSYYPAQYLQPGRGYWVKVTQNGMININKNYKKKEITENNLNPENKIIVGDDKAQMELFYNTSYRFNELPPLPPSGIFDARFIDNTYISDNSENIIRIQSKANKIYLKLNTDTQSSLAVYENNSNKLLGFLTSGSFLELVKDQEVMVLKTRLESIQAVDFRLFQNYPNPFNPSTTIQFSIPEKSRVQMKLYDILGNELYTILDEILISGFYTQRIDLSNKNLPSGTYFIKLINSERNAITKILYMK